MDGHRRYADEPDPGWYAGKSEYSNPAQNSYDGGVHERPSGAFRLPEQRENDYIPPLPYVMPDPVTSTGGHARVGSEPIQDQMHIPVRGPEYPTIRPSGASSLADAPPSTYGGNSAAPAPASPAPASGPQSPGGTTAPFDEATGGIPQVSPAPAEGPKKTVYRTRRPVSAVLAAVVTIALMVPVLGLLMRATFTDDPLARGVVPAVLLTLGVPLTGLGLYSLAGGGPVGRESWLRPPLAYLPVGLVLLIAASLAVA